MPRELIYEAGESDRGRAVRDIIRDEFQLVAHDVARAKYRTEGGITVDGVQVLVNRRLSPGETLTVRLANELPGKIVPAEGPLDILYEDEDVIGVNKPAGVVVHPSHGHFSDTLANYLAAYYLKCGDPHEIRTAGRLDKDTTGVLLFGKSRSACAHLTGQIGSGGCRKCYLAVAEGRFVSSKGTVDAPISREYEEKIRRVVRPDGDSAVTHYRVLRQTETYAVLALRIETGRTHQIRVHMAHIGHPLLGDPIYGGGGGELQRAALHALSVHFSQPFTREPLTVTAPVPDDLRPYIADGDLQQVASWFE